MSVEEELARSSPRKNTLLTVGVFDGVHLGHKYLLSQLAERARQENCLSGVVTFSQHPQEVLSPQAELLYLTDLPKRIGLLKDEGVDTIATLTFTSELARLTTHQFIGLLQKHLKMCGLVIGPDFALGKDREGNIATLSHLGAEMGFNVTTVPPLVISGEVVSSTAIRKALAGGDMKRVRRMTGRHFSLHGSVTSGVGRGKELGFPTANLDIDSQQALPPDGVYATRAYIGDKAYPSVTNIGQRPTFGSGQRTVEVHIPGHHGDLYQQALRIDIVARLRNEQQFGSAGELKEQIARDIEQGKTILIEVTAGEK
ncbi:bifunctional riboflavin kinase/FAD synthetase [Chloroflexota bacterium]